MEKLLTFAEVDHLFPNEWVLMAISPCDRALDGLPRGTVMYHSLDPAPVLERAARWEVPEQSVRFTGGLDRDVVYVL